MKAPRLDLFAGTLLALLLTTPGGASGDPAGRPGDDGELAAADRARLAAAFRLFEAVGERVWPGWDAPFPVLLVTENWEYLVRPPAEAPGFGLADEDPVLGPILVRPPTFTPGLLATFPALPGVSTVVIGRPETTGLGSTRWVVTVLHEHFHQFQMSAPGYWESVEALGLSGGDGTGRWMLDYPFPYDEAAVREAFDELAGHLALAVRATEAGAADEEVAGGVATAWDRFVDPLSEHDARYFAFQVWQEGIARWVELAVAESGDDGLLGEVADEELAAVAAGIRRRILADLEEPRLDERRRVSFYAVGAALGIVLEAHRPGWKERYLVEPFSPRAYLAAPGAVREVSSGGPPPPRPGSGDGPLTGRAR